MYCTLPTDSGGDVEVYLRMLKCTVPVPTDSGEEAGGQLSPGPDARIWLTWGRHAIGQRWRGGGGSARLPPLVHQSHLSRKQSERERDINYRTKTKRFKLFLLKTLSQLDN